MQKVQTNRVSQAINTLPIFTAHKVPCDVKVNCKCSLLHLILNARTFSIPLCIFVSYFIPMLRESREANIHFVYVSK